MNHFFFSYAGNKRSELKEIDKFIKLDDIDTIIEPYCGSSSISNFIYNKYDLSYNYILNDIDENLILLYKTVRNDISLNLLSQSLNEFRIIFNTYTEDDERKKYYNEFIKHGFVGWFVKNKYYCIRAGLYPSLTRIKQIKEIDFTLVPIYKFLKNANITFSNINALEIIKQYKDCKNVLMILDPPYIQACNSFYSTGNATNLYKSLFEKEYVYSCKMLLILENMWINKMLFEHLKDIFFIKSEYNKTYEMTKKKTTHIIITNY